MSRPAVLSWQRSIGRCVWTGVLGGVGLCVAVIGWVVTLSGDWVGLTVLAVGVLLLVLSELAARRYRQVTAAGLRWQRTWRTQEYGWQQVGLSTREPPGAAPETSDRVLVHHRGGTLTWPEPHTHNDCARQVAWWQRAQREFPYGDFRAFPGLFPNMPKDPATRRLHNPGRRAWQAVFAVVCTAALLVLLALAISNTSETPTMVGWLLAAGLAAAGGWVALRNATSRVWVHPDRIEQRRWFARRQVRFDQIAGSYVLPRPYVVGLGFLMVIGAIISLFSSGSDSLYDEVNNQQVPTLLLRDGTAVPLRALTSRSTIRVNKLAVALVDPGVRQAAAPQPPIPRSRAPQPPPHQSQW